MEYYRILKSIHASNPLGFGQNAGRWNSRNYPVIYASSSVALSMTEYLCIKGTALLNTEWSLVRYFIKEEIPMLKKETLPVEWDERPYPLSTQLFGEHWQKGQASVCLKVPSARLLMSAYPREHNILINPFHRDFLRSIEVKNVENLYFHLNAWATGNN